MSTSNPKPRDLNKVVLVVNGDECRLRRDDEATESGKEMEHTKFIVAVNIGVRGCARRLPNQSRRALT